LAITLYHLSVEIFVTKNLFSFYFICL